MVFTKRDRLAVGGRKSAYSTYQTIGHGRAAGEVNIDGEVTELL